MRAVVEDDLRTERLDRLLAWAGHQLRTPLNSVIGVYHRQADDFVLFRIGCNRWDLQRAADGWRIARRTTRVLGSDEAQAVLAQGLPR